MTRSATIIFTLFTSKTSACILMNKFKAAQQKQTVQFKQIIVLQKAGGNYIFTTM